jgi:archaellum component FlaC
MSKTDYNRLCKDNKLEWLCTRSDCIPPASNPVSQLAVQMTAVLAKLDELLTKVDKIDGISKDVSELRSEVSTITTSLSVLEPRVTCIENKVESITHDFANFDDRAKGFESRLSNLESRKPESDSCVGLVVEEINQRALRAKNIMVFGLVESKRGNVQDRIADDREKLQTIASAVDPSIDVSNFKIFRVGKGSRNNPRPLKVVVGSEDQVGLITKKATRDLLSGLGAAFSSVTVGRDRTKNEISLLNNLRAELARRTEAGEVNLTIKYINGNPKIIESKNV